MSDTTIKKVCSSTSPTGDEGQVYLASGKRVAMRLWRDEPEGHETGTRTRDYETVGFVLSGRAELHVDDDQVVQLREGDSWLVPAQAPHRYRVLERFTAVEATAPPARVQGRDADTGGDTGRRDA